ncbi:MAG TPA: c-type cytochrome [Gammaproteobacteria bacterium]
MSSRGFRLLIAAAILAASACAQEDQDQAAPQEQGSAPPAAAEPQGQAAQSPDQAAAENPDRAAQLARGKYLVETIAGCGNCHTPHLEDGKLDETMAYAGEFVIEEPVFTAYAANITPDMETGIGSWSEEDIVKALREGVRPDGRVLGPPMPFHFYNKMSDTDAYAIAAYIKTVEPIRNEVPQSTFDIPLMPQPPAGNVPDVPRDDPVKYGEYLAGPVGHCMDCHTTYVNGVIDYSQLGRGGNVYRMPFHYDWTAISANITPHEDGLGGWTDEEIKRAITQGVSRDGRELLPFMPFDLYAKMEERDLDAIVAYLRSLPPLPDVVPAAAAEEPAAE